MLNRRLEPSIGVCRPGSAAAGTEDQFSGHSVGFGEPWVTVSPPAYSLAICSNHKVALAKATADYAQWPLAGYPPRKAGSRSGSSKNWLHREL